MSIEDHTPGVHDVRKSAHEPTLAALSSQQCEVLDLLLEFKTANEISAELGMPANQVDAVVERARSIIGARSRAELARIYSGLRKNFNGNNQPATCALD